MESSRSQDEGLIATCADDDEGGPPTGNGLRAALIGAVGAVDCDPDCRKAVITALVSVVDAPAARREYRRRTLRALRQACTMEDPSSEVAAAQREWSGFCDLDLDHRAAALVSAFPGASVALVASLAACVVPPVPTAGYRWLRNLEGRRGLLDGPAALVDDIHSLERCLEDGTRWGPQPTAGAVQRVFPVRSPTNGPAGRWSWLLGREVNVDSRLEREVLRSLDSSALVESICEQPVMIDYEHTESATHKRYVPDFLVGVTGGGSILVEVKPISEWLDATNAAKWTSAFNYAASRGWGFLVTDGRSSPLTYPWE
jgi:hypothetical protein